MAKTGLPNFTLKIRSTWKGNPHIWSMGSNHSGAAFTQRSDQLAFLDSVWQVLITFMHGAWSPYVAGIDYYDGVHSAALLSAEYPTQAASVAAGFTVTNVAAALVTPTGPAPLESCCLLYAPIGMSKTGKPVTMRKFIHATGTGASADVVPIGNAAQAQAQMLGNGQLYGTRVLCSPKGAQGTWAAQTFFANHQMPRGRRKKVKASDLSFGTLLNGAKDIASVLSEA